MWEQSYSYDLFVKVKVHPDFPEKGEGPSTEWIRWSDVVRVRDEESKGSVIVTRRGEKIRCKEKPVDIFEQLKKPHRFGETQMATQ